VSEAWIERYVGTLPDGRPYITQQTVVEHFGPELRAWIERSNYWRHSPLPDIWVGPHPEAA
jgi:hypothetical protein